MTKKDNKSSWIIGGTTLIGLGVGFLFLKTSALYFLSSIFIGIGAGILLSKIISKGKMLS